MKKPTKEEYTTALKRKVYLEDAMKYENKNREKLINELCVSQKYLNTYATSLNEVNEIVKKYEIYRELKELEKVDE